MPKIVVRPRAKVVSPYQLRNLKMSIGGFTLFSDLLARGVVEGYLPARTHEAREWFREKASQQHTDRTRLIAHAKDHRGRNRAVVGRMYFYLYDPKTKDDLPYYDIFPLVFPIERYPDGFLGINLHYLPLKWRAKLMDALYSTINNDLYDYTTKLRISYNILKRATKFKAFRPCVKRYLYSHVRSKFIEVYAAEWDMALMLPVASFKKATQAKVHRDSVKMIQGR